MHFSVKTFSYSFSDGTTAAAKSNRGHRTGQQVKPKSQSGGQTRTSNQLADGSRGNRTRRNDNFSSGDKRQNYPSQYYSRGGGGGYDDGYYYYDDSYYGNQRYSAQQQGVFVCACVGA